MTVLDPRYRQRAGAPVGEDSPAQVYLSAQDDLPSTDTPMEKELLRRPPFGIRLQMTIAFSVVFALSAFIAGWSLYSTTKLQSQLRLVEIYDSYLSEIQQTRRYEKDYLLYGTNIEDSWAHLARARELMGSHRAAMVALVGADEVEAAEDHARLYSMRLDDLSRRGPAPPDRPAGTTTESELREHGAEMVSFAQRLSEEQRRKVDTTFRLARRLPFVLLVVLLLTMLAFTAFLSRRLISSFSRFAAYTERIGRGDFSPIRPFRPYRDEFSQLALAFNHMIAELDRRHDILVESHKMRAIGDLVAGVAHEINNPLNNIFLTASALLEDYDDFDEAERIDMVQDVMQEAERAQRIVRNLLDFARQSEVQIKPIMLDEVLRQSVALVANQIKMARIELTLDVPPGLPPVHGDPQMLAQVIVNLVLNAVDALEPGGNITVSVGNASDESYLEIVVRDDGPGIPEHVLPRIFEPFFTTKKEASGTGLGLSVSRGIVKKLGGTIRVRSTPGEGTEFIVMLPTTDIPFEV